MKFKNITLILIILIIGCFFISTISAQNFDELNSTIVETDDISDNLLAVDESQEIISSDDCCEEPELDTNGPKTWYVNPDPENPNQVQAPTVQPVIDSASLGDIIVLNGTFVHCHFLINKTLTIVATPQTSVGVCPHHTHSMKYGVGPETNGVFYISPEASGTVLSGFSFTNDFYTIANNVYNPFGVFVDADNVVLENLTFNWTGVKSSTSKFDPQEFLFDAIILNNAKNISINNILIGNVNSFLTSINASEINTNNITIFEEIKVKETLISEISAFDLKVQAGNNGVFKVTLKDANNNPVSDKTVSIVINGVSKNVTTDSNGNAKLTVKYSAAGVYYATVLFLGDDDYKASIDTAKITVTKKVTVLTVSKATLKVKKAKKIKITLKSGGKAVAGKKITIKVNKKTFSAKTNSKGIAYVKVKLTKKGTFNYVASFAGDKAYKAVSKSSKIVVKK